MFKNISLITVLLIIMSINISVSASEVSEIINKHNGIRTTAPGPINTVDLPAQNLLGNGDIGVVAGGTALKQDFIIGKNGFYTDKAEQYKADYVDETGYAGSGVSNTNTQIMLGGISITIPQLDSGNFNQEMDMYRAESRSTITKGDAKVRTTTNVNADENIVLTKIENLGASNLNVTIDTWTKPLFENKRGSSSAGVDESTMWITRTTENFEGALFVNTGVIATQIIGKTPAVSFEDNTASGDIILKKDEAVYVVSKVLTDENYEQLRKQQLSDYTTGIYGDYTMPSNDEKSNTPLSDAITRVKQITEQEITELNQNHINWWSDFWSKSWVQLSNEPILEKYWYSSLYILASASREGKPAPGLFGPWVTTDIPHYNGDYTLNYNFQHTFYGTYAANHPELSKSFQKSTIDNVPLGRRKAKDQFGYTKGIYFGTHAGPTGLEWTLDYDYEMRSNALECSVNFIKYYLYTKDKESLKDRIYPYMKEVIDFWEQNLVLETGGIVFNATDSAPEGWAVRKGGEPHVLWPGNGFLNGRFIGYSPMISSPSNIDISTNTAKSIKIRMKINRPGETLGIFFGTDQENSITADKLIESTIKSSDFEEYEIDMSTHKKWTGILKQLRIDPVRSGPRNLAGEYNIDYIQILDENKNILKEWDFNASSPEYEKYHFIRLKLKNNSDYTTAYLKSSSIFGKEFGDEYSEEFNDEHSLSFTITPNDADFKEYIIDLSTMKDWGDTVGKLKLEIPGDTGTYKIEEASLIDESGNIKKSFSINTAKENVIGHRYSIISAVDERKIQNYNACSAIAYLKHLTKYLVQFSEELGEDEDRRPLWNDINTHLPDYPITVYNGKEVFAFDEGLLNPKGNVYPFNTYLFYPTNNEGIDSPYAQLGINSIDVNENTPESYFRQRNSFTQVYAAAARMGYPFDKIISNMRSILKANMGSSNIHLMPSHKTIENAGATENITSLLLQSNEGFIRLFPAANELVNAQFQDLRTENAFLVSASLKNKVVDNLKITSENGGICSILLPWDNNIVYVLDSQSNVVQTSIQDGKIIFDTSAGMNYFIYNTSDKLIISTPQFLDQNSTPLSHLQEGIIFCETSVFNDTDTQKTCTMLLALYDDNGNLLQTKMSMPNKIAPLSKEQIKLNINIPNLKEAHRLNMFLWDDVNNMIPLTGTAELKNDSSAM